VRVDGSVPSGQVGTIALAALRHAQSTDRPAVVPVRRASLVFAAFSHIRATPETGLQDGVPIYKLRILDALIDRLSNRRKTLVTGDLAESVDARIERLARELSGSRGEALHGTLAWPWIRG